MVKRNTSLTVEHELIEKAKLHGLNISNFLENKLEEYFLQVGIASNITAEHKKNVLRKEVKIFLVDAPNDWEHFLRGRTKSINRKYHLNISMEQLRNEVLTYLKEEGEKA